MPLVAQSPNNRIILGLMTYGPDAKAGARVTSFDEFTGILDEFQSRGYSEVDTARLYGGGTQEGWTGQAGWQDRGLTLATKHYPTKPGEHEPQSIRTAIDTSLKELRANTVDIFYLHAADRSVPFRKTLKTLDELHKEKKFVRLGLSNFTSFEVAEVALLAAQNGWVRPTIYQGVYNAIHRAIEPELIPACRRYGLDIVVYNPIAGGLLTGKYTSTEEIPSEGRFSDQAWIGSRQRERYFRNNTIKAVSIIKDAAEKHGLTTIETALRWLVHHSKLKITDGNDGIIIGASSKEQLNENLTNLEKGPLPEELVQVVNDAWIVAKSTAPDYWHLDLKYTYDPIKEIFG